MRGIIRRFLARVPGESTDGVGCRRQVISLGAGFDSVVFQLQEEGALADAAYYELDCPQVVLQKGKIIAKNPILLSSLAGDHQAAAELVHVDDQTGSVTVSTSEGRGRYCLRCADLRELEQVHRVLAKAGLLLTVPTLLVAECVLIYMHARHSDALISWASATFSQAAFVLYEQIRPHDDFGRMMVENIAARGCPLLGIGT